MKFSVFRCAEQGQFRRWDGKNKATGMQEFRKKGAPWNGSAIHYGD
jgi:hypothetical protein